VIDLQADAADAGKRLDHFLQARLPQYSRSRLQDWIKRGRVRVNGAEAKASHVLRGSEAVSIEPAALPPLKAVAEDLPIDVIYEDTDVIAVNKPAGMVVHAGAGNHAGTLTNALVHRFGKLSTVGGELRPGIVHRLDRYTSGVLLVARTDAAHHSLAEQFAKRKTEKTYLALVEGHIKNDHSRIEKPIVRDPARRTRMTAKLGRGRAAATEYRVLRRFQKATYLEVKIGTGRTHQIRVHLASIGHPVVGDKLYGAAASPLGRYFLHAHRIGFTSPSSGERVAIAAPLPPELVAYLEGLEP
jgi:23S rRNA pseudouridine1911/1915/1917 synthase